jgi:signal transduction histidine kinase
MGKSKIRVLMVEDNMHHAALTEALMAEMDMPVVSVEHAPSFSEAITRFEEDEFDVCLLDYKLGAVDGLHLLRIVRSKGINTPVILLTSMGDEEVAVEAMKAGASDYIRKEKLSAELLSAAIRYALEVHEIEELERQARAELQKAKEELELRVEERTAELREAYDILMLEVAGRKRAEQELRSALEALEEADRLRNQMIQNISHEFRTPLGYIVGYVELMLDNDSQDMGPLTEQQQHSLQIVAQQGHKLTRLVNNFVLVQKPEIIAPVKESVDVGGLLSEAVESAQLEASDKDIALSLDLPKNLTPVMVDRMAMVQVLDNLLNNACKFTGAGGKVAVRAWQSSDDDKVHVSVEDTGKGVPEDIQERIFERFYQHNGAEARQHGGVGLGLAVCKEILDAHGEKIWVESTPEKGAKFTFTMMSAP